MYETNCCCVFEKTKTLSLKQTDHRTQKQKQLYKDIYVCKNCNKTILRKYVKKKTETPRRNIYD